MKNPTKRTCPECGARIASENNGAHVLLEDHMRLQHGMYPVYGKSGAWRRISERSLLAQGRRRYTDVAGLLRAI